MEVIHEVEEEREAVLENGTFGHLNLKKQYRRAFIAAQNRIDWRILEEKTTPKNVALPESVYFYLEFHPGVYKLVADKLSTFLCKDHKIKLRSGIPNRYGATTTTIIP